MSSFHLPEAIAGMSAGASSTLLLHPLDLIRIRFQVQDGKRLDGLPVYRGTYHAISTIIRTEGIRALYHGLSANLLGGALSWGFYFYYYDFAKKTISLNRNVGALEHMAAASMAGALTLLLTNPIWVIKTRMCSSPSPIGTRPSFVRTLVELFREGGLRGMYKGLYPGLFGVSHGAFQFMAYEEMKKRLYTFHNKPSSESLSHMEYMATAALSKTFATVITYPYQVVRSRLQDKKQNMQPYVNSRDVISKVWRNEGIRGFYKGLAPNILRVIPGSCIVFVVYEHVSKALRN